MKKDKIEKGHADKKAPKVPFPVQALFQKKNAQVTIYHKNRGKK